MTVDPVRLDAGVTFTVRVAPEPETTTLAFGTNVGFDDAPDTRSEETRAVDVADDDRERDRLVLPGALVRRVGDGRRVVHRRDHERDRRAIAQPRRSGVAHGVGEAVESVGVRVRHVAHLARVDTARDDRCRPTRRIRDRGDGEDIRSFTGSCGVVREHVEHHRPVLGDGTGVESQAGGASLTGAIRLPRCRWHTNSGPRCRRSCR